MASTQEVRRYLAHWFQLGKGVTNRTGQWLCPTHVFLNDRYTAEFEECWQHIQTGDYFLAGTDQTLVDLLSSRWDVVDCSRCAMPIPLPAVGLPAGQCCPCQDLPNWPNNQVPLPQSPIAVAKKMTDIRQRLAAMRHV